MPRILRIINRFNLGGPTYNVAYLSKYLSPEFETLLIGGEKDESEESSNHILQNLGLEPIIISEMKREIDLVNDYKAYLKIKKIIQEFKPDIVHTHASKAGTIGRLAAKSCNVPVIVHTFNGHVFHSYFGKIKTALYKNIERYLAKKTSCIVAISEKQKYELSDSYRICDPSKISIVRLGFDLSKFQENVEQKRKAFREKYAVDSDELVVSIIGRLVPIKNHRLFVESIAYVKKHSAKKVRAFIIGDGEERKNIEAMILENGLSFCDSLLKQERADISFTSWSKEIDVVCAGSDIITLTSFNEGTPVSLIEAQAANKPIVSTQVGGIENVVTPHTALLSDIDDKEAFYVNLLTLVSNDELRNKMGTGGWENVKERFHYTALVNNMKELYHKLLLQKATNN